MAGGLLTFEREWTIVSVLTFTFSFNCLHLCESEKTSRNDVIKTAVQDGLFLIDCQNICTVYLMLPNLMTLLITTSADLESLMRSSEAEYLFEMSDVWPLIHTNLLR